MPWFLLAFGVGMVVGTWLAGELADWSVFGSLLGSALGLVVVLLLFAAVAPYGWWLLPVGFLVTVLGSVLVVNLQLRLMDVAGDAQTIGAASNHASLNIANAAGAALGGLVIAVGLRLPRHGGGGRRARRGRAGGARGSRPARPAPGDALIGSGQVSHGPFGLVAARVRSVFARDWSSFGVVPPRSADARG